MHFRVLFVQWHRAYDATAFRQLATTPTDADNNFTPGSESRDSARPVCIQQVVSTTVSGTGRLGVQLPVWIIVLWSPASKSSHAGSSLAAHRPSALVSSWCKWKALFYGSYSADILWKSFSGLNALKLILSSHVDSKLKNGIPENMEIAYIIYPRTIVCIHSKAYIKYTPLDLVHQKFVVRIPLTFGSKYTINRTVGN